MRDARTILDTFRSKIPGLSQSVLARRDRWGEPIENQGALGIDGLSAIYESRVTHDPVNQEPFRLGIAPAPLEQKIRGVQLTPDQFDDFQRIGGRFAKGNLDTIVKTPG
jgi:hypothetical protein